MRYLHTMVRVHDLDAALKFFCEGLGLVETRRRESEKGRFTLVFLRAPEDAKDISKPRPEIELTYNWDQTAPYTSGRNFGHLAYAVDDIYSVCEHLQSMGITILRPPRDGRMAFIKSPDGISVELLQDGEALELKEPWVSMESQGSW